MKLTPLLSVLLCVFSSLTLPLLFLLLEQCEYESWSQSSNAFLTGNSIGGHLREKKKGFW